MQNKIKFKIETYVEIVDGNYRIVHNNIIPITDSAELYGERFSLSDSERSHRSITLGSGFAKKYGMENGKEIQIVVNGFCYKNKANTHNKILGRIDGIGRLMFNTTEFNADYVNLNLATNDDWYVQYDIQDNALVFTSKSFAITRTALEKLKNMANVIRVNNTGAVDVSAEEVEQLIEDAGITFVVNDKGSKDIAFKFINENDTTVNKYGATMQSCFYMSERINVTIEDINLIYSFLNKAK